MIEEKIVIGEGTPFPLNGILTLPDSPTHHIPAVVLVQGSGSTNMDSKVKALTPFKDIAAALAQRGIATIRYDKRSFVHARKMVKLGITVWDESIEDAIFAADMLRADPRIGKIFIFGHSQGGMLAPRIDAEGGDFDGLIIAAGSTRMLRTILKDQSDEMLERYRGPIRWLAGKQVDKIFEKFAQLDTMSLEESKGLKMMGGTTGYYFKDMEAHPPSNYLPQMTKPIFVFQGEKDFQVKVDKDFEPFHELLADNPQAKLKVYPGLNHVFTTSHQYGTLKDYKVAGHVDEGLMDEVAAWIHAVDEGSTS